MDNDHNDAEIRIHGCEDETVLWEQHGNTVCCYRALFNTQGDVVAIAIDGCITVTIPWQTGEKIKKGELRLRDAYNDAVKAAEEVFEKELNSRDKWLTGETLFPNNASALFSAAHSFPIK